MAVVCAQDRGEFVEHHNTRRLHSAIGYVRPADKLTGHEAQIFAEQDRKLEHARGERAKKRQVACEASIRKQLERKKAEVYRKGSSAKRKLESFFSVFFLT